MNKELTSFDLYIKKVKEYSSNNLFKTRVPQANDIKELLEVMKAELIISGYSRLMDVAHGTCCYFCMSKHLPIQYYTSTYYYLTEPNQKNFISPYAAWWFLLLLPQYLSSGDIPNAKKTDTAKYFFKNCAPKNPDFKNIICALEDIDNEIIAQRKKMYHAFVSDITACTANHCCEISEEPNNCEEEMSTKDQEDGVILTKSNSNQSEGNIDHAKVFNRIKTESDEECMSIVEIARKEAELEKASIINNARQQIEAERQTIINAANQQIDIERGEILGSAKQQAEEIVSRAIDAADKRLVEAKKRVTSLCVENRSDSYVAEQECYKNYFLEIREALCKTNAAMKQLEDTISEQMTKKIYTQLLELYNLIADTRDFSLEKSRKNNDIDLENTAYNMEVFLDMIVECLADFGIETIFSMQGEDFSGKYHEPIRNNMDFDPRHTIIKKSLRNGFVWGEQVIQKEKVEI